MKEHVWKPFGSSFWLFLLLLIPSSLWACQRDFEVARQSYQARLQLNGNCERGMYMLQLYFPNGQQQSIYQVYQAPVTGLWMGSISAQEVPDVVMAQMNEGKLIALLLYVWQGDRYVQHHIPAPKTSQLEGYTGQDKIYVRWDQLIRQLQIQQGEQQVWRRLVYKVDQSRWLSEEE